MVGYYRNCAISVVAAEFCEQIQFEIDVFIFHCKYQVKLHSFP